MGRPRERVCAEFLGWGRRFAKTKRAGWLVGEVFGLPKAFPTALAEAMKPTDEQLAVLEAAARQAALRSYSPYSRFRVGAAILTGTGKVYTGTNVENASYGLCNCAERTAVFSAVAAGERVVSACVVYTPTVFPTAPCGACRQVLREFGPEAFLRSICDGLEKRDTTIAALLPDSFGPEDLGVATPGN